MEISKSGHIQYHSDILEELWACGRTSIEDINENNIIYIAQYSLKKFKNNLLNKQYKSIMSFSNRSKMSTKWARRNYKEIEKGFIKTKDGKVFKIPESYKKVLKNSNRKTHVEAYNNYEEKVMEYILNNSNSDIIKQQKIKEEIYKLRHKDKIRDL